MKLCLFLLSLVIVKSEASGQSPVFTYYPVPSGHFSSPYWITPGPDGNLWFTESSANKIGRITTAGVITEFPISGPGGPIAITAGRDGNLWFTQGDAAVIGRITPLGAVTLFRNLSGNGGGDDITAGTDGNVWFPESGELIGSITPRGLIREFNISPLYSAYGITAGPDGNMWFTDGGGGIGRITPAGAVKGFSVQTGFNNYIAVGPDGNFWITGYQISRVTPSGQITQFPIVAGVPAVAITARPDGTLWFTELGGGGLGSITTSGLFTPYQALSGQGNAQGIALGSDGNIWITDNFEGQIVKAALPPLPPKPPLATPAPSSLVLVCCGLVALGTCKAAWRRFSGDSALRRS